MFVSVEFCGYVFVGQSLCVCSSADSSTFVYVTPVVFPPRQGGVCLCVYFYCACLCGFERGQDLWMPDLGQLVEAPGCSLFLGFCPDL